nr:hypothetical protein [Iodidimonas gelatinilytica]
MSGGWALVLGGTNGSISGFLAQDQQDCGNQAARQCHRQKKKDQMLWSGPKRDRRDQLGITAAHPAKGKGCGRDGKDTAEYQQMRGPLGT